MGETLKRLKRINAFLIVFNGQNPRFDDYLLTMIKHFKLMFGEDYFKNTAFLFTRWK